MCICIVLVLVKQIATNTEIRNSKSDNDPNRLPLAGWVDMEPCKCHMWRHSKSFTHSRQFIAQEEIRSSETGH